MDESRFIPSSRSTTALNSFSLAIYPVDHAKAGDIIDDELYKALVAPLPPGCRLTVS